jgi:sterol desaturase/sphingolipid hydroxylase (fatty acid hydroxylase superfamily)
MNLEWVSEFASLWLSQVIDLVSQGNKRVFVGYLLSALALACVWLKWQRNLTIVAALNYLLSPKLWWSKSSRADYQILLLNQAIMLLLRPLMLSKLVLATGLFYALNDVLVRPLWPTALSASSVALLFTFTLFVVDDASRYYLHRLMHRWPLLWAFHRVHHTAQTLTPLTVLRTHPVEGLLFGVRSALVQGVLIGVFVFLFADKVSLVAILGANVFTAVFNLLGANLRHSHVSICYGQTLELWLISPAQHQLHHSRDRLHWDCNYGAFLALWDRMGNTLLTASSQQQLSYGLPHQESKEQTLSTLYWQPFVTGWQSIRHFISRFSNTHRLSIRANSETHDVN